METKLENLAQEIKNSDAITTPTELSTIKPQLVQDIPQSPESPESPESSVNVQESNEALSIDFSNVDNVVDYMGKEQAVTAPKDLEH